MGTDHPCGCGGTWFLLVRGEDAFSGKGSEKEQSIQTPTPRARRAGRSVGLLDRHLVLRLLGRLRHLDQRGPRLKSFPLVFAALSALGLSLVYHEHALGYGVLFVGIGFAVPRVYTPRALGLWLLSLLLLGFAAGCLEPIRGGYSQPGPKWAALALGVLGSWIALFFSRKEENSHAELIG